MNSLQICSNYRHQIFKLRIPLRNKSQASMATSEFSIVPTSATIRGHHTWCNTRTNIDNYAPNKDYTREKGTNGTASLFTAKPP